VTEQWSEKGDEVARVRPESIVAVCRWLKDDPATDMKMLVDLTAIDWWDKKPRFEVVYTLRSLALSHRVRLKVPTDAIKLINRTLFLPRLGGLRELGHPLADTL
jgi:NADH:ubiquinone oxidoreductase subunit C